MSRGGLYQLPGGDSREQGGLGRRLGTREVFDSTLEFAEGGLKPSDEPGLGIHLDERLAADHPYEPAYLPTNRLLDGTVHDW